MNTPFRDNSVLGAYQPARQVVLCHGCFDVLHLGHIRHLQEAAKLGDWLTVSVTADKWVKKGIGRPHFSAEQRAEALRALGCVDEVIINDDEGAWDLIRKLRPSFFVKGIDYVDSTDPGLEREKEAIAEVGGQMRFTGTRKWSSSQIINTEKFSDDVCQHIDWMKKLDGKNRILEAFAKADEKRIIFVGETIIDYYNYVQGLGRASKELMLATVSNGADAWDGGVIASSKHGEWKNAKVITQPEHRLFTKRRYVDSDFNRKLFDVYSDREVFLSDEERDDFRAKLQDSVGCSDVVIVNDFGHGMMGEIERNIVSDAGFLAVNCQTNAGNYGFNLVTKYPRADYVCIDDPEARLAAGMQKGLISSIAVELAKRMDCQEFLITHGRSGSDSAHVEIRKDGHSYSGTHHPALVDGGIDTMGAGDAVMAVTAPLIAAGLHPTLSAFVGNIVGAIKVSILGHRRHVGREEIIKTVEALLA